MYNARAVGLPGPEGLADTVPCAQVNPRIAIRESGTVLRRLDEEISFNLAKAFELSKEGAPGGTAARQQCSGELVKLASQKVALFEDAKSREGGERCKGVDLAEVGAMFGGMVGVIEEMITEVTTAHEANEKKHKELSSRLRVAMMGDDEEHR